LSEGLEGEGIEVSEVIEVREVDEHAAAQSDQGLIEI
jgi:hypothetical protein